MNGNGGCDTKCENSKNGPVCKCNTGFRLKDDGKNCTSMTFFLCNTSTICYQMIRSYGGYHHVNISFSCFTMCTLSLQISTSALKGPTAVIQSQRFAWIQLGLTTATASKDTKRKIGIVVKVKCRFPALRSTLVVLTLS